MIVDIHNHTPLCNHAKGSPLQYATKAFDLGYKYYGFSDHAPMDYDPKYRMSFAQMRQYEDEILQLRRHFEGKMEILLGYEVDFLAGYMDDRVLNAKVDYLIGSVHFLDGWGFDNPEFIREYEGKDIDAIWEEYFGAIERLAKSRLFDIVGHIDLIKVFKFLPKKDVRLIAQNAIKAIKKAGLVVELNAAGYRKPIAELYPSDAILELLAQNDILITFASDAHAVSQVGQNMDLAVNKAREFGYKKAAIFKGRDRIMVEF